MSLHLKIEIPRQQDQWLVGWKSAESGNCRQKVLN